MGAQAPMMPKFTSSLEEGIRISLIERNRGGDEGDGTFVSRHYRRQPM